MSGVYPLNFEPILVPKPWGGDAIARIQPQNADQPPGPIGESWMFVDLPGKSSVIANGPLKGRTFAHCVRELGEQLLGDVRLTARGGYPLLIKYLDARQNLSVQVHPATGQDAKTEALYVLNAADDAVIYRGFREHTDPDRVRKAVEQGTIAQWLEQVRARPDRCYFLPGGTCHAYGAGIFGVEVQTPSETTYRVFDWGRTDRELHVDQALDCMDYQPTQTAANEKRTHVAGVFTSMSLLCSCDFFTIEKVRMAAEWQQDIPYDRPSVWVVLSGQGKITNTPAGIDVAFKAGQVLFVPPNMPRAKVILEADTQWLDLQIPYGPTQMHLA